jgi:Lon-like ATP-dependent protease
MCTANVLDTIPGPLLDRMEVIRWAGFEQRSRWQGSLGKGQKTAAEQGSRNALRGGFPACHV